MRALTFVLLCIHIGVAAAWLGAMGYSLFTVQPALARLADGDPRRLEDMQRELAHGNRWRVVALIAALWASGTGLVWLHPGNWVVVGLKAVLLAGATALFWWVSWRGWPRRVFALPDELAALQLRFRAVATTMFALVAAAFALGLLLRY
jgi:Flp pilus assembly protein TadB